MGKERGAGGGGGDAATAIAIDEFKWPWNYLFWGSDTSPASGDMSAAFPALKSVLQTLTESQAEGNPHDSIAAYDPNPELDEFKAKYDGMSTFIDDMAPDLDLNEAFAAASDFYDDYISDGVAIDDAERMQYAASYARISAGMFDIRAVMSNQMGVAFAGVEEQRRLNATRAKAETIMMIVNAYMSRRDVRTNLLQQMMTIRQNMAQQRILANQDVVEFDAENKVRKATWSMDRYQDAFNFFASVNGAVVAPREMTKRERALATFQGALSTGLQAGVATGNPALGLGAGLLNLGTNLWAQRG